jgi:predicted GNAT superfamily acetyltransferase
MPPAAEVEIRPVATHSEFAACEAVSRAVWGTDGRNVVPRELLLAMEHNGGVVLGAFAGSGELCGFVVGFLGQRDGAVRLWSHQLGVLPAYRQQGLGQRLKWAQREAALAAGVECIAWTFDPLEARNAYLNLYHLGVVARHYSPDHYGPMDDALNAGLPTDRLEAEWWLTSPPVVERSSGRVPAARSLEAAQAQGAIVLLRARAGAGGRAEPELVEAARTGRPGLIAIPRDFQELKGRDRQLAAAWREQTRTAFETALTAGLRATDFVSGGAYWLEPRMP